LTIDYKEFIKKFDNDYFDGKTSNWDQPYTWESQKGIQEQLYQTILKYFPNPNKVLVSGCSLGATVKTFHEHGHTCVGVDITNLLGKRKLCTRLIRSDVRYLPFKSNSFDLCINVDLMEHIPNQYVNQVLNEQARVAKNHFFIIVSYEKAWNSDEDKDITHINIKPLTYWHEKLSKLGKVEYHHLKEPLQWRCWIVKP